MADEKKTEEDETPTPTQDELNAINRRLRGLAEPVEEQAKADAKAKADADAKAKAEADAKAVEADKSGTYRTRQAEPR